MRARMSGTLVALVGSLTLASACAARSGKVEHASASKTSAGGSMTDDTRASAPSRVHEVTWAEYYAEAEERVRRWGGTVIWINPPRTSARTLAATNATVSADPRGIPQIR